MIPFRDTLPSQTTPVATFAIIAVNVFVFLYQVMLPTYEMNEFVYQYALIPARFQPVDLVTCMFLHGSWMHIIGNMWFLWIYGDNVEDILGPLKYVAFYLTCGVAASVAQMVLNPDSRVPIVGASGAIAGVMGAYLVKFPHSRILALVFIFFFVTTIEVPATLVLVLWFAMQFFSGVGDLATTTDVDKGGVAYFAHIGGFIMGLILIKVLKTKQRYRHRVDVRW